MITKNILHDPSFLSLIGIIIFSSASIIVLNLFVMIRDKYFGKHIKKIVDFSKEVVSRWELTEDNENENNV